MPKTKVTNIFFFLFFSRDDQNVKDDRGEAAGADTPRAQTDANQLHEHYQRAAARSYLRCVFVAAHVWANDSAGH